MKRAVRALVLTLALGTAGRTATAQDADPWFGADKVLHFGASVGIAVNGYAAGSLLFASQPPRLLMGGAIALSIGASKELWDLTGHGDPSWRDFTWDVIGTVAGLALAWGLDALFARHAHPTPAGVSVSP